MDADRDKNVGLAGGSLDPPDEVKVVIGPSEVSDGCRGGDKVGSFGKEDCFGSCESSSANDRDTLGKIVGYHTGAFELGYCCEDHLDVRGNGTLV